MNGNPWTSLGAAGCVAGALAVLEPGPGDLREAASWIARPAALPFAWRALQQAREHGTADEAFVRAQQLMALLPTWTDGYVVTAMRFCCNGGELARDPAARAAAAQRRLLVALAWLESARAQAGHREIELLQMMAELPGWTVAEEPALAGLLRPLGGAEAMADRYLATAEALGAGAALREARTFRAVGYATALLDAGDRTGALRVLDRAIERSADVKDHELAATWRDHLVLARRRLAGEAPDLTAVREDPRFGPLLPHLR